MENVPEPPWYPRTAPSSRRREPGSPTAASSLALGYFPSSAQSRGSPEQPGLQPSSPPTGTSPCAGSALSSALLGPESRAGSSGTASLQTRSLHATRLSFPGAPNAAPYCRGLGEGPPRATPGHTQLTGLDSLRPALEDQCSEDPAVPAFSRSHPALQVGFGGDPSRDLTCSRRMCHHWPTSPGPLLVPPAPLRARPSVLEAQVPRSPELSQLLPLHPAPEPRASILALCRGLSMPCNASERLSPGETRPVLPADVGQRFEFSGEHPTQG